MTKSEPRNYVAEARFVRQIMAKHRLTAGYVPYGHVIHIFKERMGLRPLCGSSAGYRNRKRLIEWGDGICRQCLRILQKEKSHDPG